jgi:hypothetical protein
MRNPDLLSKSQLTLQYLLALDLLSRDNQTPFRGDARVQDRADEPDATQKFA